MNATTVLDRNRDTETATVDDGWKRDSHYISSYPDVQGLKRDGNCYCLPAPRRYRPWRKAASNAEENRAECQGAAAHMILSRLEWATLSGCVQIKKIHVTSDHNRATIEGLLLDPLCRWADIYSWRLEVSESAADEDEDEASTEPLGPEFLQSRGFSLVEVTPTEGERWQREPCSLEGE